MSKEANFFRQNKWLYHFTKFGTAKLIIQGKRLKFGSLSQMNDANENRKTIYNAFDLPHDENMFEGIECEIDHYQQISLSEDKSIFGRRGFDLQQMWGIYADKGFGVCLVFDKVELLEMLPKTSAHGSVIYNAEMNSDVFTNIRNNEEIEEYIKSNMKYLFFNKRKEWEHEQEYRIVNKFEDIKNDNFLDFNNSLKYVVMFNANSIKQDESILNSNEYNSLKQILPKEVKILIYSSFLNEQSLICYDWNQNGETFWNSSEEYNENINIDI